MPTNLQRASELLKLIYPSNDSNDSLGHQAPRLTRKSSSIQRMNEGGLGYWLGPKPNGHGDEETAPMAYLDWISIDSLRSHSH